MKAQDKYTLVRVSPKARTIVLRQGPSASHEVVTVLSGDVEMRIAEASPDGWIPAWFGFSRGWVDGSSVTISEINQELSSRERDLLKMLVSIAQKILREV